MRQVILTFVIFTIACLPKLGFCDAPVSLLARWIDALGNQHGDVTINSTELVWEKVIETDKVESPALRISLTSKLPSSWKLTQQTGDGAKVIEPLSVGKTQTMVVDLYKNRATFRLEFVDKKNHPIEMSLIIQATVTETMTLIRPECAKQDLHLLTETRQAQHLFVGLNCIDNKDSIDVYFFRSSDSTWNTAPGLVRFDPDNKFNSFKYHIEKPKDQVVFEKRVYKVGTVDENQKENVYALIYSPKEKPQRLYYTAGLGVSYNHYHEQLSNITLSEIAVTGKGSVGYRLIPKVLDVALITFATLLPLHQTPSTFPNVADPLPSARFYGVNVRLGYRLPIDLGATEFMFLTGLYLWGMWRPPTANLALGKTYGFNFLYGPQLYLQMRHSQVNHAGYWVYVKYAPIANQFRLISGENREYAIGGGIDLSTNPRPFSITLDIAQSQFSTANNAMKLISSTVGIQKAF